MYIRRLIASLDPPSNMPPLKYTLPTFLFFSLCGFYFIIYQMEVSDAPTRFLAAHEASHVPLDLTGGRFPLLDSFLRPLISFFVSAFADPQLSSYNTVVAFVWSFSSAIQLPLVESLRIRPKEESGLSKYASRALSLPLFWGVLYQRLSGGFIIPIWLFFFLHSQTYAPGHPRAMIRRMEAESAFVGWWLGHTLPALIMLIPNQPALCVVPLWIAFPILMSVSQHAYLFFRKKCSGSVDGCGHKWLRRTYYSAMVASFMGHAHVVVIPALGSAPSNTPTSNVAIDKDIGLMESLQSFFFAVFSGRAFGLIPPTPAETTSASGIEHFVRYDVLIVFSAVWVALLWDLALRRRPEPVKKTTAWLVFMGLSLLIGSLIFSPGTTTGYLMKYREDKLNRERKAGSSHAHHGPRRNSTTNHESRSPRGRLGSTEGVESMLRMRISAQR